MAWYRGLADLSSTTTGKAMVGGALASSATAAVVLNRVVHVGTRTSVAAGVGFALAGVGAIAYLGHRLVKAGEELAIKTFVAEEPVLVEP